MSAFAAAGASTPGSSLDQRVFKAASAALLTVSWLSAAVFGAYILAFYGGAAPSGQMERWNAVLPRLYEPTTPLATLSIGAHFLTGGVLLLLGPVQLVGAVRARVPAVHRWLGRVYVVSAALAGVGGLAFILFKGTVGGAVMNVGFGLYGALMILTAAQTWRHGAARRLDSHRAWGVRLFALAIGSWLYRMEYGFWFLLMGETGHTAAFSGWFDHLMAFFFYVPNLVVAELYLRARRASSKASARYVAAGALAVATVLVGLGTYFFTVHLWGPGILGVPVQTGAA
jgi:hypothetical protein